MQYMKLTPVERQEALRTLASMKDFLDASFASLTREETRAPGPEGSFSPVEQVWHLAHPERARVSCSPVERVGRRADLEREGFSERIRRLQAEDGPSLPDFDGARIAAERS